jgi:hypothetical protein
MLRSDRGQGKFHAGLSGVAPAGLLSTLSAVLLLLSCGKPPSPLPAERAAISRNYSIGPLSVVLKFSARKITMAEFITIEIAATGPASGALSEPVFETPLEDFAVYARSTHPPRLGKDGRAVEEFQIVLAPNGPGERTIPSIKFEVLEKGRMVAAIATKPVEITVASLLPANAPGEKPRTADIAPDIPLGNAPETRKPRANWLFPGVAAAFILTLAGVFATMRRPRGKKRRLRK